MSSRQGNGEGQALGWCLIAFGAIGCIVHPAAIFILVIGLFVLGWTQRPG